MSEREKSGRRRLTGSERELWAMLTRSIRPLRPSSAPSPGDETAETARVETAPAGPGPPSRVEKAREQPALPLANFDRRMKQRLARGRAAIDATLDLHGLTQARAHEALVRFLRSARAENARFVLVITGKGAPAGIEENRGVLRRQVPLWLKSPQLRDHVLGLEPAGPAHGGEGAFYVWLRRPRGPRG